MRPLIIIAALLLPGCVTTANIETYADSIYRIAHVAGEEAVKHGKLSPEKFDQWDARIQLALSGLHIGKTTFQEFQRIADEMARTEDR